jgi:Fe2+ transport system protein FeoA
MNMWQLSPGQKAKIKGFSQQTPLAQKIRLQDLGFTYEETVLCLRRLPFGGPSVFQVQLSAYAIEKELAVCILLENIHE